MQSSNVFRLFLLPVGLLLKLYDLAVEGARDIHNKFRFNESIIDQKCRINSASKIEKNCHILGNSLVLSSTIKTCSYVGRNSLVQNAIIGSYCSIANDVSIGLGAHPTERFSTSPLFYRVSNNLNLKIIDVDSDFTEYRPIEIGNDVWIGARAIILDGVKIGDGAIIAANAVVTKDVPPYAIVGGIPASIIRYRFSQEKIDYLLKLQWWSWPINDLQKRINELNSL